MDFVKCKAFWSNDLGLMWLFRVSCMVLIVDEEEYSHVLKNSPHSKTYQPTPSKPTQFLKNKLMN